MVLTGPVGRVSVQIDSFISPRERRAVALAFFRQIRPFIDYFSSTRLSHFDNIPNFDRDEERGVFDPRSPTFNDPIAQRGFEIRMRRLSLGFSQEQLAKIAELSVSQLSKVERGLCRPHAYTLIRLERALSSSAKDQKS